MKSPQTQQPPRQLHPILTLLLSPIAPFYTLPRSRRTPLYLTLPLTLLTFALAIPILTALSEYAFNNSRPPIHNIYSWLFLPQPDFLNSPPILTFTLFFLFTFLILAMILTPRVASPRQNLRQAYPHALHRLCLITPAIFLIISLLLIIMSSQFAVPNYIHSQHMKRWQQRNPNIHTQITSNNIDESNLPPAIKSARATFIKHSTITYTQELRTLQRAWHKTYEDEFYTSLDHSRTTAYTRTYLPIFITASTLIGSLLLLLLLRLFANTKHHHYQPHSHWPATCESCGYHIFQSKQTYNCPECGKPITTSLSPNHRIGSPTTLANSRLSKYKALIPLTLLFLFKPTKLASQLRAHSTSPDHHQTARLALSLFTIITPLAFVCTIATGIIYNISRARFVYDDITNPSTLFTHFIHQLWTYLSQDWFFVFFTLAITLLIAYTLIQLFSFTNSLILSIFYRRSNPQFAHKLANLAAPAMIFLATLTYPITLITLIICSTLPNSFFRTFLPRNMFGPNTVTLLVTLITIMIFFVWYSICSIRILKHTRFANT